jgi:hypothetical protein
MGQSHDGKETLGGVLSGDNVLQVRPSEAASSHHHHKRHPSCQHCHLQHDQLIPRNGSTSTSVGPKLPRLQLSTSGLGFSDSEFEIAPDSPPRKVMLIESERQIILQHRGQKLQRQQSWKNRRKPSLNHSITDKKSISGSQSGYWGWKNVAVALEDGLTRPNRSDSHRVGIQRGSKAQESCVLRNGDQAQQ